MSRERVCVCYRKRVVDECAFGDTPINIEQPKLPVELLDQRQTRAGTCVTVLVHRVWQNVQYRRWICSALWNG